MSSVITNILTNPAARSKAAIESLAVQALGDASLPWTVAQSKVGVKA